MVLTERTIFVEQFGVFSPVFPFYSRKFHWQVQSLSKAFQEHIAPFFQHFKKDLSKPWTRLLAVAAIPPEAGEIIQI